VWANGAEVLEAAIDGRTVKMNRSPRAADDTAWTADFLNASASGATITLTLKGAKPLTVAVVDRSPGLPEVPDKRFEPRPAWIVPIQSGDQTVVRRSYVF
jgi:hypothetical protein